MGLKGLYHKQHHEPVVCLTDPPKERIGDRAATDGLGEETENGYTPLKLPTFLQNCRDGKWIRAGTSLSLPPRTKQQEQKEKKIRASEWIMQAAIDHPVITEKSKSYAIYFPLMWHPWWSDNIKKCLSFMQGPRDLASLHPVTWIVAGKRIAATAHGNICHSYSWPPVRLTLLNPVYKESRKYSGWNQVIRKQLLQHHLDS